MDQLDYYSDRKFCPECNDYVHYLMSVEHSYCVQCGSEVRLFSEKDWTAFNESMQAKRPKGGRPRKNRGKESA
jgi:transcription initiation factor TFIIIB Brf1 subunit/transcription initiation factor TFIIB